MNQIYEWPRRTQVQEHTKRVTKPGVVTKVYPILRLENVMRAVVSGHHSWLRAECRY